MSTRSRVSDDANRDNTVGTQRNHAEIEHLPWLQENGLQWSTYTRLKLDVDIGHQTDDEAQAQRLQQRQPIRATKSAVAQNRRGDTRPTGDVGQEAQEGILPGIPRAIWINLRQP